jgi:hypothetical protein
MIVVIAVVGLIAGLVLTRQPWMSAGFEREATHRALADALRLARSRAIVHGRNVSIFAGVPGFSVDGGPAGCCRRMRPEYGAHRLHAGWRLIWRNDHPCFGAEDHPCFGAEKDGRDGELADRACAFQQPGGAITGAQLPVA